MAKKKLLRYQQVSELPNVYQAADYFNPLATNHLGEKVALKGSWATHFGNNNPITVELGCGRGEYTLMLAKMYPNRNFIGIDIKGNRLWMGANAAHEAGIKNAAFIRGHVEALGHFFAEGEVAEIWITFADPQPGKPAKRLTAERFLISYRRILAPQHLLHLKTDSDELYESSLLSTAAEKATILYQNTDIYAAPLDFAELDCKTNYEKIHLALGKTIKYLRFKL